MTVVWGLLAFLLAVVWVVTIVDMLRRHLGTQRTVAWLLIVLILPFVGAALYWALRSSSAPAVGEPR